MISCLNMVFKVRQDITESQSHRIVEVRLEHWKSSDPNALYKQDHLELTDSTMSTCSFFFLVSLRLPSLGNLCQYSVICTKKMCFLMLRGKLLQSVLLASCTVSRHHWKESGSILLFTSQPTLNSTEL